MKYFPRYTIISLMLLNITLNQNGNGYFTYLTAALVHVICFRQKTSNFFQLLQSPRSLTSITKPIILFKLNFLIQLQSFYLLIQSQNFLECAFLAAACQKKGMEINSVLKRTSATYRLTTMLDFIGCLRMQHKIFFPFLRPDRNLSN